MNLIVLLTILSYSTCLGRISTITTTTRFRLSGIGIGIGSRITAAAAGTPRLATCRSLSRRSCEQLLVPNNAL